MKAHACAIGACYELASTRVQPEFKVSDDPAGVAAELLASTTGHLCITGGSTPRAACSRSERGLPVHRMTGELGPVEGAADSEREYELAGEPVFDLILLGLGPDAHTCSLFPGDEALGERERPVVGVETPGMAPLVSRITLTLPVVNGSRQIVFLVTGEDKSEAVARAFAGAPDPSAPASLVDGEVTVLLDEAAARRL